MNNNQIDRQDRLFLNFTHANERLTFINNFVVGVLRTDTGGLTILRDLDCPTTADFDEFLDTTSVDPSRPTEYERVLELVNAGQ